jgi:hypothetical protein
MPQRQLDRGFSLILRGFARMIPRADRGTTHRGVNAARRWGDLVSAKISFYPRKSAINPFARLRNVWPVWRFPSQRRVLDLDIWCRGRPAPRIAPSPSIARTRPVDTAYQLSQALVGRYIIERVVFMSSRGGREAVWWQSVDGTGVAEQLFDTKDNDAVEALLTPDNGTLITRTAAKNLDGGTEPVWAPDGKRLFYRSGRSIIAVDLTLGETVSVGQRRVLFEGPFYTQGLVGHQSYSVAPDGKHFVMLKIVDDRSRIVVVTNWLTEARARLAR